MRRTHVLPTPADTHALGRALAGVLRAGDLVVLVGPLGAGKTALTQGVGAGLGVQEPVTSPTFVIARVHRGGRVPLVHVDAYRLGGVADVDDLDLDASTGESVTVVEWGQGLVEQLADEHLEVRLDRGERRRPHRRPGSARTRLGGTAPTDSVTWSDVLVLALDTATPTLVAGLADWSQHGVTEVLAERAVPSGNRHAELLTPAISSVLDDAGLTMGDLDAVVTGLGPGPFTGLRVGVVTAVTLADARDLPVIGVCSLDAIGSGARTVVTDARRKEVYWATYDEDDVRTEGPAVVRPEELGLSGPFVGDPAFAERLGADVSAADVTTAGLIRAAAAQLADPSSAGPLVPLYLRRPDATPPTTIKAVTQA